jgi:hypothetical protein
VSNLNNDALQPKKKAKKKDITRRVVETMLQLGNVFHDANGGEDADTYIRITTGNKNVVYSLDSAMVRRLMRNTYRIASGGVIIGRDAEDQAIKSLQAVALHGDLVDGVLQPANAEPVYHRVASVRDEEGFPMALYYDLSNAAGEVVEITASGWRVTTDCPVAFVRKPSQAAQVTPTTEGADLNLLWKYIPLEDDHERALMAGMILSALEHRTFGGYIGASINGQQGSGKTETCKIIRRLVDPTGEKFELMAVPNDISDLWLLPNSLHLLAFDNISKITQAQSDVLCKIATGAGDARRTKYTNGDLVAYAGRNPIILNGIPDLVTYGDLADRVIQFTLPVLEADKLRPMRELQTEFRNDLPMILGSLFNAMSEALRNIRSVTLSEKPRMVEAALFVTAGETAWGWERGAFVKAYLGYINAERAAGVDSDPFAKAVADWLSEKHGCPVDEYDDVGEYSAGEVLDAITRGKERHSIEYFPRNARTASDNLRRVAPFLRAAGLIVQMPGRGGSRRANGDYGRWWTLGTPKTKPKTDR